MISKLEQFRRFAGQLPRSNEVVLDWEWHSFIRFQSELVNEGILKHRPPTTNHLRELTRLVLGEPMKAPRSVEARWAKRAAAQLAQEAVTLAASPQVSRHSLDESTAA